MCFTCWFEPVFRPLEGSLALTLRKLSGETLHVQCQKRERVAHVKRAVMLKYGIPENVQILMLGETVLRDHTSLSACGLGSVDDYEMDLVIASEPQCIEVEVSWRNREYPPIELQGRFPVEEWKDVFYAALYEERLQLPMEIGILRMISCFSFFSALLFFFGSVKEDDRWLAPILLFLFILSCGGGILLEIFPHSRFGSIASKAFGLSERDKRHFAEVEAERTRRVDASGLSVVGYYKPDRIVVRYYPSLREQSKPPATRLGAPRAHAMPNDV